MISAEWNSIDCYALCAHLAKEGGDPLLPPVPGQHWWLEC